VRRRTHCHQYVSVMYTSSKIGFLHDSHDTPDARGLFALSSEQAGYFTSAHNPNARARSLNP